MMAGDKSSVKIETFMDAEKHLRYGCIGKDDYQVQMQEVVEPYLRKHITSGRVSACPCGRFSAVCGRFPQIII